MADKLIDPQQDALFREVDDDLRHEYFTRMWKRCGGYVVAVSCALIIFVAAWQAWQGWVASSRLDDALAFEKAFEQLDSSSSPGLSVQERVSLLRDVALRASAGHGALARLHAAAELAGGGRAEEAIALWHDLRDGPDVDPIVRDIARFLAVQNAADLPAADLSMLEADLDPLTSPSGNLKYLALELKGLIALQRGDAARASGIFDAMIADQTTPSYIRERVRSVRSSLAFTEGVRGTTGLLSTSQRVSGP